MVLIAAGVSQVNQRLARLEGEQDTRWTAQRYGLSELRREIAEQKRSLDALLWDVMWIRERLQGRFEPPVPPPIPDDDMQEM